MKKSLCIILIVSLFCVSSCSNDTEDMSNAYISFATIFMTSYSEANGHAEYGAAVYEYNLESKEITEILNLPTNTMYYLGVYDKKTNSVYYSKEKDNDT